MRKLEEFEFYEIGRDSLKVSIFRIFGAVLSFSVLILIVKWTVNLYERDIDDLPLLLALQDETRFKPIEAGGKVINFKGLSVNNVLGQRKTDEGSNVVKLAPSKEHLFSSENSPVLLPADQFGGDEINVSRSITAALENLLGLSERSKEIGQDKIELHIASYGDAEQANAHWFLLQQSNSDLLVNYNHQVVKVNADTKEIYRLRIVGFKSIALAQDMCDRLIERGERCVPAVGGS